jgi:hypothetical protein
LHRGITGIANARHFVFKKHNIHLLPQHIIDIKGPFAGKPRAYKVWFVCKKCIQPGPVGARLACEDIHLKQHKTSSELATGKTVKAVAPEEVKPGWGNLEI